MEKSRKKRFLLPSQPAFINCAQCLWHGIFPLASLGYLSGSVPSQLLYICSLAEHKKLKEVLDFLVTTKNNRVINTLLLLNPVAADRKINSVPAKTRKKIAFVIMQDIDNVIFLKHSCKTRKCLIFSYTTKHLIPERVQIKAQHSLPRGCRNTVHHIP